jgi:hypothetical protein
MEKFLKNQQIPLTQVIDPNTGQAYYAPQNVVYDDKVDSGPTYLRDVIVDQATTASYFSGSITNAISASYALTASYVAGGIASASFATSASYALTSSFATRALSASYAVNGGVTQLLAGPNISLSPTNGLGQVTVSATLSGSTIFNTATGSYGSFYDTTTQTNPVANIARSMSLNSTDITNGVSVSGSTNPFNTYIKTENAGVYDIQFSAQVDKTDGGSDDIVIWLRKNGIDSKVVAAWNWFVTSANGDYYQIIWRSADTDLRLLAEPITVDHPGIPSVIVTANRVDQFLSNTGSFSGSFTGAFTGSFSGSGIITSASFASTASYVNPLNQTVIVTGSLIVSGSSTFTNIGPAIFSGSITQTASTASFGGLVGIGTTTPSQSLDVNGTARIVSRVGIGSSPLSNRQLYVVGSSTFEGQLDIRATSANARIQFTPSANDLFIRSNDGSVQAISIFQGGNIAMGSETNAGYKLDINGTTRNQSSITLQNPGSSNYLIISPSGSQFLYSFKSGIFGGYVMTIDGSTITFPNSVGFTSGLTSGGFITTPNIDIQSSSTNRYIRFWRSGLTTRATITHTAAGVLQFRMFDSFDDVTGGVGMYIDQSGNVGITGSLSIGSTGGWWEDQRASIINPSGYYTDMLGFTLPYSFDPSAMYQTRQGGTNWNGQITSGSNLITSSPTSPNYNANYASYISVGDYVRDANSNFRARVIAVSATTMSLDRNIALSYTGSNFSYWPRAFGHVPGTMVYNTTTNKINYWTSSSLNVLLDSSGSQSITGSLTVTGGITGSITSASFASTASFVNPLRQVVQITGSLSITGSAGTGSAIYAYKSGSTVLDIQGSQGQLFSVTDALSGSLMSVNDVSGLPILEVFSDDRVVMGTYGAPALTVTGSTLRATGSLLGTASYATTALSASYAPDTTFPYTGSARITGSLGVTGSFGVLNGDALFANSGSKIIIQENSASINTPSTLSILFGQSTTPGYATGIFSIATGAYNRGTLILAAGESGSNTYNVRPSDTNITLTESSTNLYKTTYINNKTLIFSNNTANTGTLSMYWTHAQTKVALFSNSLGSYGRGDFRIALLNTLDSTTVSTTDTRFMVTGDTYNVLIGTTTDAGYKLDVNGTARSTNFRLTDNTVIAAAYTIGGTSLTISNTGHNNATGISTTSAVGIRTYSNLGVNNNNLLGASIYAAGGSSGANISLGLLSNRALITSAASGLSMHTSSMLQVDSTTQGFLPPRTNLTSNISTPAQGLMTYITGSGNGGEGLYYYNSGSLIGWHKILSNSGSQSITGSLTVTGGITGSITSASYALSASYAPSSPAFPYTGSALITGSLDVEGNIGVTGSINFSGFGSLYMNNGLIYIDTAQTSYIGYNAPGIQAYTPTQYYFQAGSGNYLFTSTGAVISSGSATSPSKLLYLYDNVSNDATLKLEHSNFFGSTTAEIGVSKGAGAFFVYATSNDALIFGTNNTERARISTVGNVGIGTNSPAQKLTVEGGHITTYDKPNKEGKITFNSNASSLRWDGNDLKLHLTVDSRDKLTIETSAGYVGINQTSPSYQLDVSGSGNYSNGLTVTGSVIVSGSDITTAWTSYTPVWTAASSNPVIGNGTIEGYYKVIGKTCFVRGNIAMGSTTTFGSGEWYVSMPFTASHADAILMTAQLLDNGTAWYNATLNGARAGFNYKTAIQYQATGGTANDVNATQPFTWTTSDRFLWNGSFEIA